MYFCTQRYSRFLLKCSTAATFVALFGAGCVEADESRYLAEESTSTGDGESTVHEEPIGEQQVDLAEIPIRHPLAGVAFIDGKVPAIDIKNSPTTGKRFAYGERTFQARENAPLVHESGVVELERGPIPESYAESKRQLLPPAGSADVPMTANRASKLGPELQAISDSASPGDLIDVRIRIVDDFQLEHVPHALERQIGLGNIKTQADLHSERQRLMADRRVHIASLQKPVVDQLNVWGLEARALPNLLFVHARVPAARLEGLAAMPRVHSLSVSHQAADQSGSECPITSSWLDGWVNGEEVVQGTQIQQFLCAGYDAQPANGAYRVAVMENGVSHWNYGRYDWQGGPSRWSDRRGCGFFYCDAAGTEDKTEHAAATTGLIAGDLTQEQDANYTSEQVQVAYSGYAPEAVVYGYALEEGSASFETAVDDLLDQSILPLVTNISWGMGDGTAFHDCIGDWDEDEALNSMFEAGILPVKAAGNDGNDGTDCRIGIPGSAVGSFTVGGHGGDSGIADVRSGNLYSNTSRGGYNGGQRSIVDLTAPAWRRNMASTGSSDWTYSAWGTSFAAPTVSAAALDFADFYETTFNSSWILNPGALTANLLLMGDREEEDGSKATSGYDDVWGAGRMLMRMFNAEGMDTPWYYGRYGVCVDDGETVTYSMSSVSGDVELLKVVAYWYDRRHDANGTTLDDIDLRVRVKDSNGNVLGSRSSLRSHEEKERVYFDMGSYTSTTSVEIELSGYDVTADNEGCGTNSNLVYIAWYYEDHDRDDADGPGNEILPQ